MISPQALLVVMVLALTLWVGEEVAIGVQKAARAEKRAAHAIVHALKRLPHPHRHAETAPDANAQ